jgi:TonB family protein
MIHLEESILTYLINSLWQVPLLFAAGWVGARSLRRLGPLAEHRLWMVVLVLQTLLPACSLAPFDWLAALPFWGGAAKPTPAGGVSVSVGPGLAGNTLHLPAGLRLALVLLYGLTCAYFVGRFLWRSHKLAALRGSATALSLNSEMTQVWERCASRFAVTPALAESDLIAGPVTIGMRRPLLLLPPGMADCVAGEDFASLLAHEFAHIRRGDFAKNLLCEALTIPTTYHPFQSLARERVLETREMVCDALAAGVTGRTPYAHSLLRLASLMVAARPVRTPHAIGIFDANTFERRLMKLTEKHIEIRGLRRFATVAACAALAVATCGTALALRVNLPAALPPSGQSPVQQAPSALKVSPGVIAGNLRTKVAPVYPPDAKAARVQGSVVLHAIIGKDGTMQELSVLSGSPMLTQSAIDAVRQWVYEPYLLNGEPTEVETTITVNYSFGS